MAAKQDIIEFQKKKKLWEKEDNKLREDKKSLQMQKSRRKTMENNIQMKLKT